MRYDLDVRDAFFFAALILIPVALLFKYMFVHAAVALVISLFIYHFMPKVKYIRARVKGTSLFYYFGLVFGATLALSSFFLGGGKGFFFFIWMIFYFSYGMLHAGRLQKLIDVKPES
jgi:hypothetical protein